MVWVNPYRPVESEADLPRFCGHCSRPMVNDDAVVGYDGMTGEPRYRRAVKCPKGRFGEFGLFSDGRHEAFSVSPRPRQRPQQRSAAQEGAGQT